MIKYTILIRITLFQISDMGGDGLGGVDAVLYQEDLENGVVGTSNLLEMVPGVLEGQTSGGLFSNSLFDPSVIGANIHPFTKQILLKSCKK